MQIRGLRQFYRRHTWLLWLALFAAFILLSVVLLYIIEKKAAPDLTFFDAFSMTLVLLLGEYGETPLTEIGKFITLIDFVAGTFVVVTVIGKVTASFVKLRLEGAMPKELEKHIVICNWNNRGDRIIKEIHAPLGDPNREIIVICEQAVNERELRAHEAYEKVYFIRSDPTLHDVLKRARAHLAKSVIVLADDESSDPDAKTALIALAITMLEKSLPRKPHIIAEVVNHRKIQHLIDAGVDEWVCATDYGLGIIAQSALYSKLSDVYQQLLTYSKETNEIYLVAPEFYPQDFVGMRFDELAANLNAYRDPENPAILLGFKRDEKVILNPRADETGALRQGDSLVVMAFDRPDLRQKTQ